MDASDQLKPGTVVFYGDKQFQILKPHVDVNTYRFAVYTDGRITFGMDQQNFRSRCRPLRVEPGGAFDFGFVGHAYTLLGFVTFVERVARTIPAFFGGGELPIEKYGETRFRRLLNGDPEIYARYCEFYARYCEFTGRSGAVDLTYAALVEAQLAMPYLGDVTGFTKYDLMAYVVAVNGEGKLGREDIMRKVAALERKPWIRTSNTDYFKSANMTKAATLVQTGKGKYGRVLFGLGDAGRARAAKVIARLGEEPGRI